MEKGLFLNEVAMDVLCSSASEYTPPNSAPPGSILRPPVSGYYDKDRPDGKSYEIIRKTDKEWEKDIREFYKNINIEEELENKCRYISIEQALIINSKRRPYIRNKI